MAILFLPSPRFHDIWLFSLHDLPPQYNKPAMSDSPTSPVFVLNGPNLNQLGTRQPEIYGTQTLAEIEAMVSAQASKLGLTVDFRQTNHEGVLIDWIQEARHKACGIILNAASLTHTSVGLFDAIVAAEKPLFEVHLSNPYAREAFRHKSYVSAVAKGVICGLGPQGYLHALDALARHLNEKK